MRVYVDNVSVYALSAGKIDTSIAMSAATHNVVIQAWDTTGAVFKQALTLTVTASSPLPVPPSTAFTYSDIDQMTGWQSCTTCAGIGGTGL